MFQPESMMSQLVTLLDQINEQIKAVNEYCAATKDVPASYLRKTDGGWVMIDLIQAKAQVLNSMVLLEDQFAREKLRSENEEKFKIAMEQFRRERIIDRRPVYYVYSERIDGSKSVRRVGQYSQSDEWIQSAAEDNPDLIYFEGNNE